MHAHVLLNLLNGFRKSETVRLATSLRNLIMQEHEC